MLSFTSPESFSYACKPGTVYCTTNPHKCADFSHIIGHTHLINGVERKIEGVEHFMHGGSFREGEPIALYVRQTGEPVTTDPDSARNPQRSGLKFAFNRS